MKKHFVFFIAIVVCLFLLNTNMFSLDSSEPPVGAVDVVFDDVMLEQADEPKQERVIAQFPNEPSQELAVYDFGVIRLKSGGYGKCVGVTLVPKGGQKVELRAQRFTKSFWGSAPRPGKVLSKWTKLSPGGMRIKFDRAGGSQDHYKLFCRVKQGDHTRIVECRDAVSIEDIKPGHCWSGPGSTDAPFGPLNMTIKNK